MTPAAVPPDRQQQAQDLRQILKNGLALLVAYVLPRSFTFAAVIVAARTLGSAGFGDYGTAAALAVILSILATLGMMPLLIRDLARDPGRARPLLGAAHRIKTGANLLMLAVLYGIARGPLGASDEVLQATMILGLGYAVGAYGENLGAYFQAVERMDVWMRAQAAFGIVSGVLGALLVAATTSLPLFCLAFLVGQATSLAVLLAAFRRTVPRAAARTGADSVLHLLRRVAPFAAAFVALAVYYKIDVLLLARWRDAAEVGLYAAARKFFDVLQALALAGVVAVYPKLSRSAPVAHLSGRWVGSRVTELAMLVAVPVATTLWLVRWHMILFLYGASYEGAVPALGFLAVAVPALCVNVLAGYVLATMGKMKHVAGLFSLGILANVGVNAVLIPAHGAAGAGMALLASESLVAVGSLILMATLAGASPSRRTFVLAGLAAAVGWGIGLLGEPTDGIWLSILYVPAVALVYWRGGAVNPGERAALFDALRPPPSAPARG